MANTFLTIGGITKRAIALFMNSNAFLMNVNRQYDDSFGVEGAKIGSTLRVRLPNDYTTVKTVSISGGQATTEQSTTITVATQATVPLAFTSQDLALQMDDFEYRILKPAINNLAGTVASDVMSLADNVPNYVAKTSAGAVVTPDISTWLLAGAKLDNISSPRANRKVIMSPLTQARTVATFSGFFNPTGKISDQYDSGEITSALGYKWMSDQTTLLHTTATFTAEPTVNGASQTGSTITINATVGAAYSVGDIVTIAGVYAVNRVTKASTGVLQQFVVTQAVTAASTQLKIYPALIPASSGAVQYQTVDASPANGAQVSCVTKSAEQYRKNFVFLPEAFTLITADLPVMSKGVIDCARENFDGISMRMVRSYDILGDQQIARLDMLYGWAAIRPDWACIVADIA